MAQFSRRTILAAIDILPSCNSHAHVDRLALEHGIEEVVVGGSLAAKALALSKYLIQNPEAQNEDGQNLTDTLVGHFVEQAIQRSSYGYPREFHLQTCQHDYEALNHGFDQ